MPAGRIRARIASLFTPLFAPALAASGGCESTPGAPLPSDASRCGLVSAVPEAAVPLRPGALSVVALGESGPGTSITIRAGGGLPPGFKGRVLRRPGSGATRLEIKAPAEAGGSATGEVAIDLDVGCDERVEALRVRAVLRPPAWRRGPGGSPAAAGPSPRRAPHLFRDASRGLFVFGGEGEDGPLPDLWRLVGEPGTWRRVTVEGPPFARVGARLDVAGAGEGPRLLYGGLEAAGATDEGKEAEGDLFALGTGPGLTDPARLEPLEDGAEPGPPGDFEPAFARAPGGSRAISACGWNRIWGTHCRVRAFDLGERAWRELETAGEAPEGRFGAAYALDGDRLVVFGGDRSEPGEAPDVADDAFALLLGEAPPRWFKLGEAPGLGRKGAAFSLDAAGRRLLVWGGTRDGSTPLPGLFALALDPFEEGEVHELFPRGEAPPPRIGAAAAPAADDDDPAEILFGFGEANGTRLADLWILDLAGR